MMKPKHDITVYVDYEYVPDYLMQAATEMYCKRRKHK
jgi:hypothetical protein